MKKLIWIGVLVLGLAGLLAWRWVGPVRVQFVATLADLPFEAEVIPAVVWAQPGEVVSVTYRIRNNDLTPLEAYGKHILEPTGAKDQVEVFLTQCSGLNTFQNSVTSDYLVMVRVASAGWFGASQITLRHEFTRVVTR
jgi:hypothetical protein